ncbi:MAG: type II toxin-antitoxin system HicA family toxin [Candidatus Cyclobacteriaceae bacterium M3_2C_046]
MKRNALLKHLKRNGCFLLREGKKHSIFINPANGKEAPVPRHTEIKNIIGMAVCKELEIPVIGN